MIYEAQIYMELNATCDGAECPFQPIVVVNVGWKREGKENGHIGCQLEVVLTLSAMPQNRQAKGTHNRGILQCRTLGLLLDTSYTWLIYIQTYDYIHIM